MTYLPDTADQSRPGLDLAALDRADRILLGSCAVVWLAALGAGVAATVALVDLTHGQADTGDTGTPWFLYTVIGVSAAVIIAAVPLLLRARRSSGESSEETSAEPPEATDERPAAQKPVGGADAPTEKLRAATPTAEASGPPPRLQRTTEPGSVSPAVDQVFLRFGVAMMTAMGVATLLTGIATYLMAVETESIAWVLYGVAGVVTVGMGAVMWYFLRELATHTPGASD
ncbi:hypothetical protein FIV07_16865 [Mycobacterium sp. THAF192]|nr:hypothetical protein FIV07_16865 [Mycobacterium sp. THAF192]